MIGPTMIVIIIDSDLLEGRHSSEKLAKLIELEGVEDEVHNTATLVLNTQSQFCSYIRWPQLEGSSFTTCLMNLDHDIQPPTIQCSKRGV